MEFSGGASGGTIASIMNLTESYSFKDLADSFKPFGLSPIRPANFVKQPTVTYDERLGWLGPWMMGSTNQAAVCRTYGLLGDWGDRFSYKEYMTYGSWFKAKGFQLALGILGFCIAMPPVQWMLKKFVTPAGQGPSEQDLINGNLKMQIIAETGEHTGTLTITADADPAYLLSGTFSHTF